MPTTNTAADNGMIISHITLRRAIGILGAGLPFILLIGNYFINRFDILNNSFFVNTICGHEYKEDGFFKSSISHFYYTTVGELFTGILITVALFMFCYKGHPKRAGEKGLSDNALTTIAGLSALGVVVFPTGGDDCIKDNLRTFLSTHNTSYIHFSMATVFFVSLAVMSIVNFRRTEIIENFGKGKHHKLFLICGTVMLVCLALIAIYSIFFEGDYAWLDNLRPVYCLEAIALIFFGISWLTKGQVDFSIIPRMLRLKK